MQEGSWQFNPNEDNNTAVAEVPQPEYVTPRMVTSPPDGSDGSITWTASEFVAHNKSGGWYGVLAVGALIGAVVAWFISDVVTSIVIVFAAIMLGVMGARQPRELAYRLDNTGLTIGNRRFSYGSFRSFAIMTEGALTSIVFTPMKRFAPLTTIFYDPRDEERIIALLAEHLPMEERKQDAIDRLMWRIRF